MSNAPTAQQYVFGEYRLSTHCRALSRNGKPVPLSTKPYQLLLALVSEAGQVLHKEDLIASAWPGQVVTDVALARQLTRVRKIIGDQDRVPPWIETVRGIGYRFTAPVGVEASPERGASRSRPRASWSRVAVAVVSAAACLALLAFAWRPWSPGDAPPIASAEASSPVSVAVLSTSVQGDWLNQGGTEYLAELLSRHERLAGIDPDPASLDRRSTELAAIELTTRGELHYACLVRFGEHETGYESEITLRNRHGIVATETFTAPHLGELFSQLDQWVLRQVTEHERMVGYDSEKLETLDPYAVQSYLQALHELDTSGDHVKAGEFLQAAISKEPGFLVAWVRLARNRMNAGDLDGAVSLGRSLLERVDLQRQAALEADVELTLGLAATRLGDDAGAQAHFARAAELLESSPDPFEKLAGYQSLEFQARTAGDFEAAERLGRMRLQLAEAHYALPNYVGQVHLDLANTLHRARKLDESLQEVEAGMRLFESVQNDDGMMKAYSLLLNHTYTVNDMERGVQYARLAQPYLDRSSVIYEKAFFLQNAGLSFNIMGDFDAADDQVARLRQLSVDGNNPIYTVLSEFLKMHQHYVRGEFEQAESYIQLALGELHRQNPEHSQIPNTEALAIMVSSRYEPPAVTQEKIRAFDERFPDSRGAVGNDLRRAEGHVALRAGDVGGGIELLQDVRADFLAQGRKHLAAFTGYEILEILLDHPELAYRDLLQTLEAEAGYSYHFYRLKAQFQAREGDLLGAITTLEENKLRANQLWRADDQLLLETYKADVHDSGAVAQKSPS